MSLVIRKCPICGREFWAKESDIKRGWAKCCSKTCAAKYREQLKKSHIKNNRKHTTNKYKVSIEKRDPVEERYERAKERYNDYENGLAAMGGDFSTANKLKAALDLAQLQSLYWK